MEMIVHRFPNLAAAEHFRHGVLEEYPEREVIVVDDLSFSVVLVELDEDEDDAEFLRDLAGSVGGQFVGTQDYEG